MLSNSQAAPCIAQVRNLSSEVDEQALYERFEEYGEIHTVGRRVETYQTACSHTSVQVVPCSHTSVQVQMVLCCHPHPVWLWHQADKLAGKKRQKKKASCGTKLKNLQEKKDKRKKAAY